MLLTVLNGASMGHFLDFEEQRIINNSRHSVCGFCSLIEVVADIPPIAKNPIDVVFVELPTKRGGDPTVVQISDDVCISFSACISMEYFSDNDCFLLIDIEPAIFVHFVAESWVAPIGQA